MTDEQITPALTPEEWASIGGREDLAELLAHYGDGVDMLADIGAGRRSPDACYRVLIALANAALPHGDRRKITKGQVHALRALAEEGEELLRGYGDRRPDDGREAIQLTRLAADILESLIPPVE